MNNNFPWKMLKAEKRMLTHRVQRVKRKQNAYIYIATMQTLVSQHHASALLGDGIGRQVKLPGLYHSASYVEVKCIIRILGNKMQIVHIGYNWLQLEPMTLVCLRVVTRMKEIDSTFTSTPMVCEVDVDIHCIIMLINCYTTECITLYIVYTYQR